MSVERIAQDLEATRARVAFLDAIAADRSGGLFAQAVQELRLAVQNFERAYGHVAVQDEELRVARGALRVAEERYRTLFSTTGEAYLVTDGNGVVIEANPQAGALLGAPDNLLLGEPLADFVADSDRPMFLQRLDTLSEVGQIADWPVRIQPRAGTPFPGLLTATADWFAEDVMALRWRVRRDGHSEGSTTRTADPGQATSAPRTQIERCLDAAAALPGVAGAAVLLADGQGRLVVAGTSTDFAREFEEAQVASSRGPAVTAALSGEPVVAPDLARAGARGWPWLARRAQAAQVRGVASFPLPDEPRPLGALTLYLSALLTPPARAGALALAETLADALRASDALHSSRRLAEQLEHALASRVVVEQATGILAGRHDLPVEQAQAMLVRCAREDGVRLAAYAARVVEGRLDPGPSPAARPLVGGGRTVG